MDRVRIFLIEQRHEGLPDMQATDRYRQQFDKRRAGADAPVVDDLIILTGLRLLMSSLYGRRIRGCREGARVLP